ncbi:MAG: transcriptional regulator [Lachnospiraceae bacterium]|nr:transcriptional regulator [Lachnospiraceae bacterium]
MSIIKQTNRTLLFEEINPEKPDILTLIGDVRGIDSLSDEKIKEMNKELLVRNFDEFINKFDPVVYSYYNAAVETGTGKIVYTLRKPETIPEEMLTVVHLNKQNDFLNMLMSLVEAKRSQSIINVDFQFDKLTDMISPRKVMEDIKQNRKELQYVYKTYAELEDGDPHKLDVADKLNIMFEEASVNYNNVLAMLPLAIEDIKTRLLLGEAEEKKDNTPLTLGVLSMDENGELKVLEAPKAETSELMVVDDNVNAGLIAALEEDYETLNEESSDYVKALVTRTYCPLASTMVSNIDIKQEVSNYNSYLEFYKTAKDDFIKVVKPLIEKILGVWAFFEQYPSNIKGMKPSMFITNISNDMLVKANNLPRLIAFLNTVNAKNDFDNAIWYGIVPSVSLDQNSNVRLTRQRFQGNEKTEKTGVNSVEALVRLLDVLKDYSVQCFFSYETGDKTTFNNMATEGIEKYEDRCSSLIGKAYSEYAIPCIPNFTIIPKEKSGVILDNRMLLNENNMAELSKEKEDIMKLWIDGVYVGAAYIAAGLVAAYQCPEYLKEMFKKNVDAELPGVRFDIESGDHPLRVHTVMAKEITGFTNTIKNEINRHSFGFVFSSENAVLGTENIHNIMVYKARNLMSDGKVYEPIYKTQVTTYIERILRHATGDFKQENIIQFFSNNPSSQKSRWQEKRGCVNAVIGDGDDIEYEIDEANGYCVLNITFNGNVKNLEIEINRFNSNNRAM